MAKPKGAKLFKRLLKIFLWSTITTVLLLGLLGAIGIGVWLHPEYIVNEKNLKYIKPFAKKQGLSWQDTNLKIDAKSESFYRKSLVIEAERLCVEFQDLSPSPCADGLRIEAAVDLTGFKVNTLSLRDLTLQIEPFVYKVAHKNEPTKENQDKGSLRRFFFGWKG